MHQKIVKHIIFPIHERVIGRNTYKYLAELEQLQYEKPEKLQEIRFRKLRELLIHGKNNIPFYKNRFEKVGFKPQHIEDFQDIQVLPVLTKAEIRQNVNAMLWKQSPGGLTRYNTGGSSGEPLIFYFDRRRQAYDAAARALTHRWWDIDIGDRELYLWGSPLEIKKQDRIKEFRDRLTNQLLISAFEISADKVPAMVHQLIKFKPKCLFGYPSTIALFCEMAEKQNIRLDHLGISVVFSTAEVLYAHQKETIGRFFGGIPVVDGYGSREGGFISHECPKGNYHLIDPNYVIEYLKEGKPVQPGEVGEIVITHLDAWGMPFIRYNTGDVSKPVSDLCECGRTFSRMTKVQGRTTDFIVTPDGRWQHALSLIYVVRDIEGVGQFKIIQEDLDDIKVLLKINPETFPLDGEKRITKGIKMRMGEVVRVSVEVVDDIPRDASGKYRYVVSKVSMAGYL